MNHWCDAPQNVWMGKVLGQRDYYPMINFMINNYFPTDHERTTNRIYGFADTKGGIWVITPRSKTSSEYKIVSGRLRTYTYQVLRPYSSTYQGNQGFRNNND